jgi:DsbC/DsbD-like thiol-disulfide interchange protein
LTSLLLGWSLRLASAQATNAPRVRASLVADRAEIGAGSTYHIGVRFEIEDGWHIYWRYPGGAGLATAVELELPDGLQAGPLLWPLPIAFAQSGGIPGYGYEDSVVLASEVTVPAGSDRRRAGKVHAEVSWLACKSLCVFGSAELESALEKLPVYEDFDEWNRNLPASIDENNAPFTLSTTGGLAEGVVTHWLRWRDTARAVEWFPDPSEAIEVGAVRIQTRGGLTRIDAEIKARRGAIGTRDILPSLVVITERDGSRRGWEISVDLTNQQG